MKNIRAFLVVILGATVAGAGPASGQESAITKAKNAIDVAAEKRALKRATNKYDPAFLKYSKRYFGVNFDWHPFKAQGMAESDLKPTAKSWVGARGIMQLMPSTFETIQSARPEFKSIDDPQFNIAAGIMHDRYLWTLFPKETDDDERLRFMFAAYNAGEGTIKRARSAAEKALLDASHWSSVEQIAPNVKPWRYRETLGYVKTIDSNRAKLKRP